MERDIHAVAVLMAGTFFAVFWEMRTSLTVDDEAEYSRETVKTPKGQRSKARATKTYNRVSLLKPFPSGRGNTIHR